MKRIILAGAFGLAMLAAATAAARPDSDPPKAWQDVRALVVRFNDAQNAHNVDVVGALLWDSPQTTWSAGSVVKPGHDAAVAALTAVFARDWRVLPDYSALTITLLNPNEADVTLPTEFKSIPPGGLDVISTQSIVKERAVRTPEGWRLASVAADPAPAAVSAAQR